MSKSKPKSKKKQKSVAVAAFVKKGKGRWRIKGKRRPFLGRPIVAFRVFGPVLTAFIKKHGGREKAWDVLRARMSRDTGISLSEAEE